MILGFVWYGGLELQRGLSSNILKSYRDMYLGDDVSLEDVESRSVRH